MIVVFGSINVDLIVPVPRPPRPGETVLGGDYAMPFSQAGRAQIRHWPPAVPVPRLCWPAPSARIPLLA